MASDTLKMFSHLIYVVKRFYECILNVNCTENAAINYAALNEKKKLNFLPISGAVR
jgi:hypothetical protein